MRVSIIVRTYNEARHLPELMHAIVNQTLGRSEVEVIVVDSGSSDGTPAIAERHDCRIMHIAPNDFSFGRSLNIGCAAAAGRILVFVSGHCVPTSPDWLERLIKPIEDGHSVLSYGRQEPGSATAFSEAQHFLKCFPAASEPAPNGFFCNNANAAVRADVWERFRFDEVLTGLEDLHLGKRVVHAGLGIAYVPEASVWHYHYETWSQVIRRFEREALALQSIMPEVQIRLSDAVRYLVAGIARDWARARRERRLAGNLWPIAAYRFCQYYGSWKGNHLHRRDARLAKDRYFYPGVN